MARSAAKFPANLLAVDDGSVADGAGKEVFHTRQETQRILETGNLTASSSALLTIMFA